MIFRFFSKQKTPKQADTYHQDILALVTAFQNAFSAYTDQGHRLAQQRIAECLDDISTDRISHLKIALRVKWLIREIGMMLFDHYFVLTPAESELWSAIKELNSKHDRIGHGVNIGL